MGPEGIVLVNSPIATFQQSLTHSAVMLLVMTIMIIMNHDTLQCIEWKLYVEYSKIFTFGRLSMFSDDMVFGQLLFLLAESWPKIFIAQIAKFDALPTW